MDLAPSCTHSVLLFVFFQTEYKIMISRQSSSAIPLSIKSHHGDESVDTDKLASEFERF